MSSETVKSIPAIAHPRQIKSFVQRQGRLTKGQAQAIEQLWKHFGLELRDELLDFRAIFGTDLPVTLEIGFGNGQSLADMAQAEPQRGFIGIEVHRPGVGQLLQRIQKDKLENIRVISADAHDVLQQMVPAESLDRIQLFFPDPWPKKKHHKRRILNDAFATLAASRLIPGGLLHMATDWEDYANAALAVLEQHADFSNTVEDGFCPRPKWRPQTKFERRGERLGHEVWDLIFTKRTE